MAQFDVEGAASAGAAFAEERQARILALLSERGRVRNSDVARMLGVTEPTVRKDVADLARRGQLRRTHGGAIAVRPSLEPDLPSRLERNAEEKQGIAEAAVALLSQGDAVFLDSGTTVLRLAEALVAEGRVRPEVWNLNVLTNAMSVAQALADVGGVRTTVLGGNYRPISGCFVGPLTLTELEQFSVNVAFVGVTGLADAVLAVSDVSEAQVKRAVIERAQRAIVLMDHSKLGASDFARVCGLGSVDSLITDTANAYLRDLCEQMGVELIEAAARKGDVSASCEASSTAPHGRKRRRS